MHTAEITRDELASDASAPQAHVVALGSQRYLVHLSGALGPGWSGALARELAARRISIVRGWARRESASRWEARFDLKALDPALNMFEIDFLALARSGVVLRRLASGPFIEGYELGATEGGIEVAIRAPDAVGLLHDVLATFAFYAIFPHEMTIDTRGGVAHDLFRLQRVGGGRPSDVLVASLEATLRDLIAPPRWPGSR